MLRASVMKLTDQLGDARKLAEAEAAKLGQTNVKLKETGDQLKVAEAKQQDFTGHLKAVNDQLATAGVKEADPVKGVRHRPEAIRRTRSSTRSPGKSLNPRP